MDEEVVSSNIFQTQSVIRRQISRYLESPIGLRILGPTGALSDPDSLPVVTVDFEGDLADKTNYETTLPSPGVVREEQGVYSSTIPLEAVQEVGLLRVTWTYSIKGHEVKFKEYFEVLEYMPLYQALTEGEKSIVARVTYLFGDLMDNTSGGVPSFYEEFQTHFSYERLAQLLQISVDKINSTRQPVTHYSVAGGTPFPEEHYGLLTQALYLETLRHFVRTYVEQPQISGGGVTYADRRDYMTRWQGVLRDEEESYNDMLATFKKSLMRLGRGALLVSGGIYGSGSSFRSGAYVGAVRAGRWYPASPMALVR